MRYFSSILLSLVLVMGFAFSCKKWKDPAPKDDPRLTRPYCNDPSAVNYNWDFPGKPDNTVCFYASDLFAGKYMFYDTVYALQSDLYLSADSIPLTISKISQTKISVSGLCPSGNLTLTAAASYNASVDTTVGDSLTIHPGQFFCRAIDTVVGTFTRDKVDSSIVYVELIVRTDTGTISHVGRAIKKIASMFTGIIESLATVAGIRHEGSNIHFTIESAIAGELKVDQSVAHNGVCLTVVSINGNTYTVTAVAETLMKTNLGKWVEGDKINIERALKLGDRLDGHFVQGHVDTTGTCIDKQTLAGSWLFRFQFPAQYAALVIEKGSICINGVSLTVFNTGKDECSVTIIPYTSVHTNFHTIETGSIVNIEFDVLGKYLLRQREVGV